MFKLFVFVVAYACMEPAFGLDYKIREDNPYNLPLGKVILQRFRRQTDYGIGSNGAFLSHTQNILNNDRHKLDGTAFAQKSFEPKGPLTAGGRVDYMHKPSASQLSVGASNTRGIGTDLSATGQYNFLRSRDGRGQVGAYGEYNRHLGGPFGNQRPDWNAGIRASYNF